MGSVLWLFIIYFLYVNKKVLHFIILYRIIISYFLNNYMKPYCAHCGSEMEFEEVLVDRTTSPEYDDKFELQLICLNCNS